MSVDVLGGRMPADVHECALEGPDHDGQEEGAVDRNQDGGVDLLDELCDVVEEGAFEGGVGAGLQQHKARVLLELAAQVLDVFASDLGKVAEGQVVCIDTC